MRTLALMISAAILSGCAGAASSGSGGGSSGGGAASGGGTASAGGGSSSGGGAGAAGGGSGASGGGAASNGGGSSASGGGTASSGGGISTSGGGTASSGGGTSASGGGTASSGGGVAGCAVFDAGVAPPTGTTRTLMPGTTLKATLAAAAAGDKIVVKGGSYPFESITQTFASDVLIQAAAGETPIFHGLKLTNSSHLVFQGLHFDATVQLQGSHEIVLDGVDLDVGTQTTSGLELFNSNGATHDVRVIRSRIAGGERTIFMGGTFTMEAGWNHHLEFRKNEFICGTHNCFQLSGARDTVIEDNDFHDPKGGGVLTAGATRILISRNRMKGLKTVATAAVQLATPGKEWDNYAGVEYMLSTDITVADNLITSWGTNGIELDAVNRVSIVGNTVADCVGLNTWRRVPHDQQNNVIITGNNNLKVWNNILPSIKLDTGDARPIFESNNFVGTGGAGANLVTGTAQYQDTVDYAPVSPGPAIDKALVNAETPTVDRRGRPRGSAPDIGAFEVGAPACP